MAYGNYAPFYRPGYFNPMQMQTQNMPNMDMQNQFAPQYQTAPPTQNNNDIIWVQGEAGAKAYLVAPNNTVTLWDSESPTIYVKTADMNGVPSMRILDFTERTDNAPKRTETHECKCGDRYASKEDFKALQDRFDELEKKYNELTAKPKATKAKGDE